MFCPTCASPVESTERYCRNCGSPCFMHPAQTLKSPMRSSIVEDTTQRFDHPASVWTAQAESPPTTTAEDTFSKIKRHKMALSLAFALLLLLTVMIVRLFPPSIESVANAEAITSLAVIPSSCCGPVPMGLSERISANVSNSLSALPQIKVIAAGHRYHSNSEPDPATIGRELGVRAMLTVRAVRNGHDDFTVNAALIDTRDRRQIWGQQYQGTPTDLQTVQTEISRDITEKLKPRLTSEKP